MSNPQILSKPHQFYSSIPYLGLLPTDLIGKSLLAFVYSPDVHVVRQAHIDREFFFYHTQARLVFVSSRTGSCLLSDEIIKKNRVIRYSTPNVVNRLDLGLGLDPGLGLGLG